MPASTPTGPGCSKSRRARLLLCRPPRTSPRRLLRAAPRGSPESSYGVRTAAPRRVRQRPGPRPGRRPRPRLVARPPARLDHPGPQHTRIADSIRNPNPRPGTRVTPATLDQFAPLRASVSSAEVGRGRVQHPPFRRLGSSLTHTADRSLRPISPPSTDAPATSGSSPPPDSAATDSASTSQRTPPATPSTTAASHDDATTHQPSLQPNGATPGLHHRLPPDHRDPQLT